MSIVKASYLFSGFGDYFCGHGCDANQALLYAFYGPRSTLRDVIDSAVDDAGCMSYDIPEDITDDMIRDAIVNDVLNDRGRADYECGALSEWAENYAEINGYDVCRECGERVGEPHDPDCAFLAQWIEEGEIDDDSKADVVVEEDDCKEDDDCCESPVVIFLIEWDVCSVCGKAAEHEVDDICAACHEEEGKWHVGDDALVIETSEWGKIAEIDDRYERPYRIECSGQSAWYALGDFTN